MSDTIVALATPSGESAIGVVRISGAQTRRIFAEVFGAQPEERKASKKTYSALSGEKLDDVVAVFYKAPASYTGEDSLEISAHGNPFILQSIIADIIARGARGAEPGEFTRRAFVNGKIDLSQAEAVALVIGARSQRALEAARKQLSGELGRRIGKMSAELLEALALAEAYIDFPEDDLPEEDKSAIAGSIENCAREMRRLIDTAKFSPLVHCGINAVIAGAPNAGKSSLLNAMLGADRAIVSDIAGTTRDFISERLSIGRNAVNLTDTAGLRPGGDEIESAGIERAREKIAACDICIYVADARGMPDGAEFDRAALTPRNTIIAINKCDLADARPKDIAQKFAGYACAEISCKTLEGIDALKRKIDAMINEHHITASADDILVSARHAQALQAALDAAMSAAQCAREGAPSELAAADLRAALDSLGEIVGKTDSEAVLDKIFSKFCIGK